MKADDLYDSIGTMDEELLERSETAGPTERKSVIGRKTAVRIAALVAAAALIVGIVLILKFVLGRNKAKNSFDPADDPVLKEFVLAGATQPTDGEEPDQNDYPDTEDGREAYRLDYVAWENERSQRLSLITTYGKEKAFDAVQRFASRSLPAVLADRNGQNCVYSPLNIYLMLGLLADSTGGDSQKQLLELAGSDSVEDLRARSKALWNRLYSNSESAKCILGSSVWLSRQAEKAYQQKTLERLAANYYASSFIGEMGSDEYNRALQTWVDRMTGGLLQNSVKSLEFDKNTTIALFSTILFEEQWLIPFDESKTREETFHAAGGDATVPFMHYEGIGTYYRGENYIAIPRGLSGSVMWLILPDEGVSVDEIAAAGSLADLWRGDLRDVTKARLHLGLPKFDVKFDANLKGVLQKLGVTDIFEAGKADFSQLFRNGGAHSVSEAVHAARIKVDEKGVKAAAYTKVSEQRARVPEYEDLYVTFDRPFLFLVMGDSGAIPLFAGVVENP